VTYERFVAIGDSTAEGVGDPDPAGGHRGFADRLAERLAAAHDLSTSVFWWCLSQAETFGCSIGSLAHVGGLKNTITWKRAGTGDKPKITPGSKTNKISKKS
jgi:hypothetical protein